MFPLKTCGAWCLIYTNNNLFMANSKLQIDYNRIKFSPKERVWGVDVTKHMYGVVRATENSAKIIWSKSNDYEIDTHILPLINIPYKGMYCQTLLTYELDDVLTINDGIYEYIFTRDFDFSDKKDTFIRVFITQLFLDIIIRHI